MTKVLNQQLCDDSVAAIVSQMLVKVEQFNRSVIALPIPARLKVLSKPRLTFANAALQEEIKEFNNAVNVGDVLDAADALIDLIYFALGRLVEMGVPAVAVMDEVHRANMGKQRGELSKRPGSLGYDAVKPAGWRAPDHTLLLGFSLSDARELATLRAKREKCETRAERARRIWDAFEAARGEA